MCVHMYLYMWRPEVCSLITLHFIYWGRFSYLNPKITNLTGQASPFVLGLSSLCLLSSGITGRLCAHLAFMWRLGIWTWECMLARQALFPLSPYSVTCFSMDSRLFIFHLLQLLQRYPREAFQLPSRAFCDQPLITVRLLLLFWFGGIFFLWTFWDRVFL